MKFNKTQIAVTLGAFLLIVLLLFANTKIPKKEQEEVAQKKEVQGKSFKQLTEEVKNTLPTNQQKLFARQEEVLKTSRNEAEYISAVGMWDSTQQPLIAAYFKELQAQKFPLEQTWEEAGSRYYILTRFTEADNRPVLYEKAISCFEKTLEINSQNVDTKIDLASCYVEMGANPMKGINMLREVEKTNPDNIKLQYSFAFFSMQSGQMEKAIERFEKILKLQPDNIDVYLNLADIYERLNNKQKAIEYYEKYVSLTNDLNSKKEIKAYINKLKS